MDARTLEAIKKSATVPSMPQVVLRFLEVVQDPNFEYDDIVKTLSADAGTVSEILRLCNSALFGMRERVVSLRQALTLMGPKRTRSLLLGRYLVDAVGKQRVDGLDMGYYWRRSLATAVVSSRIAGTGSGVDPEEVFVAALLADIGLPILAEAMSDAYAPVLQRFVPYGEDITAEFEQETVGASHGEVSAMVLKYWSLPEVVCTAANLHQSETFGDSPAGRIARIISASDRISKLLCEIPDLDAAVTVCQEATDMVGVDPQKLVQILTTIESDIEELASALRIDVIPGNVYHQIAKAVQDRLCQAAP